MRIEHGTGQLCHIMHKHARNGALVWARIKIEQVAVLGVIGSRI
jgi:hypothetical protein